MAHTDVTLSNDSGTFVPSLSSVPVVKGDTVSFSTSSGNVFLFFSPAAASILSPAPKGAVGITGSAKMTFTFTSSNPGAYSVFFEKTSLPASKSFPLKASSLLLLEIDASDETSFGGPSKGAKDAS